MVCSSNKIIVHDPRQSGNLEELNSGRLDTERLRYSCFYLEVGRRENFQCAPNRRFETAMKRLEIPCHLTERNTTHHPASWQKFLPEATRNLQEMRRRFDGAQVYDRSVPFEDEPEEVSKPPGNTRMLK